MITCLNINERSVGRLGNKLFIIAAVIATAKKMYPGKSEKDIVALLSKYNN